MSEPEKDYTDGEVTVIWKPGVSIHSAKCVEGPSEVFNFNARPSINMEGSGSDRVIKQVDQCPSGALSYFRNERPSKAAG